MKKHDAHPLTNPTAASNLRLGLIRLLLFFALIQSAAVAKEFYVSPGGSAAGDGSWGHPWDLQTALNQPASVQTGDTIWLRGGIHRQANRPTKFVSRLTGADNQPITVRQYPGEHATVDGNIAQFTGGWTWYWGFEIMNSQQFGNVATPTRVSPQTGPFPTTWYENYNGQTNDFTVSGFDLKAPECKLINLVVHDNIGGGFGINIAAGNAEIYGSLSFYNGWQAPDRAHGHGIYGQNAAPTVKQIGDCLIFNNFALGMQATGTGPDPVADNFDLEGNVFFLNGALAISHQANLLVGPFQGVALNPLILTNFIYDTMGSGSDFTLGSTLNALVQGNYFQTSATFAANTNLTLTGNTFISGTIGLTQSQYFNNFYPFSNPTTNRVVVRVNKYEPGRANIIIYNWQHLSSVTVNLGSVLPRNTPFEVRNAQDFYGPPVLTGIYSGAPLQLPMAGLTVAKPVGVSAPAASGPAFNAFVLLPIPTGTILTASLPGVVNGAVAWGDFDNDGKLDILLTGEDVNYNFICQIWRNLGDGIFTNINACLPGIVNGAVAWGDFDNDGWLDILLTGYDSNGNYISQVWRNQSDGTFADINAGLPGVGSGAVAWGDYDNDGYPDILLTGYDGTKGISQIWRNQGDGTFSNLNAGLPGVYHSAVAWGDYDHDGRLDILLAGSSDSGSVSQVWRNLGGGHFTNINAGMPGTLAGSVAWGDFDNDRNLDLLLTGLLNDGVTPIAQVWRNLGNGQFTNLNAGLPGVYYSSAAWGDYDNDGNLDILLTGYDGTNSLSQIWRNLGNGTFTNSNIDLPGLDKSSVAWGDYNSDGKLDLLLAGESGTVPSVQIWQNNFPPANTPPAAPTGLAAAVNGSGVALSWQPASDIETPRNGLSYNVRVGSAPGGSDIMAPLADAASGWRSVSQWGNAQNCWQAELTNLFAGTYYWSVQAIDTAFAGSTFAGEASFTLGPPDILSGVNQPNGSFQVQFSGNAPPTFTLQASTDLLLWVNLTNVLAGANGQSQFIDTAATNFPRRFYRLLSPP